MKTKSLILVVGLLLLGLILVGCNGDTEPAPTMAAAATCPPCPEQEQCPTQEACPACPTAEAAACPTQEACPDCPECPQGEAAGVTCPFAEEWSSSGHADAEAEAFNHWNEDDPAEIPPDCAACHSTPGYQDYLGADGSEMWVVDQPAPTGTTVECQACHNSVTIAADELTIPFPSGVTVTIEGPAARCAICHQGRSSTQGVNQAIADAGLEDMDTTSEELGFTNIHYFAAAATLYGTEVQGGYQYEGKSYDAKFGHVEGLDTCVGCHNSHTLELQMDTCTQCHDGSDPKDYRMQGSLVDYDGDGNVDEGIYYEIETYQEMLMGAIQTYGAEVAGTPIVYDANAYPYFFIDSNDNGQVDEGEAAFPNAYNAWTGRLAKAAYNYQTSIKDPGSYAHNGKYIIELLYDSIDDLNQAISEPVDLSNAHRIDHGHFAGSEEAFRHWDEEGMVPASCATCHSAEGLPFLIEHGVQIEQPISSGFTCGTCHSDVSTFEVYQREEVEFPSGAVVSMEDTNANLCITCHQGRSSTVQVNAAIEGMDLDAVSEDLRFINVHYFAAGATLFGSETEGAYQYEGQEYAGRFTHVAPYDSCIECHDTHRLTVVYEACSTCHPAVQSPEDLGLIRMQSTDFDGDGNTDEGIAGEVETMQEALYAAMQTYAADTAGTPLVYNGNRYPYFFADANGNGEIDEGEGSYATWTPRLLRAAYNYQYTQKDPGAFAHNGTYVMQFLYDSIDDMGGDVSGMTRP
ncbi:MAG: hypothetical protein P8129_01600 [Anaerolineae bacterium]|jgi:hypothetical protein